MALSFTKLELGSVRNQEWQKAVCSADGSVVLAQFYSDGVPGEDSKNPLLISKDYGITWTVVSVPSGFNDYYADTFWFEITADGGTIWLHSTQSTYKDNLYMTTNDGTSWTSYNFLDSQTNNYSCFAINSTGTVLVAAGGSSLVNGLVNISINSGVTWAHYTIDTSGRKLRVGEIDVNDAGTKLICRGVAYSGGGWYRTYISTDTAATWTIEDPASNGGNSNISTGVKINDDGTVWGCVARNSDTPADNFYTSPDGANWTKRQPSTANASGEIAISADGSDILVGDDEFKLFLSDDTGVSWSEVEPTGTLTDDYPEWKCQSIQGNTMLVLGGIPHGKNLYLSLNAGAAWTEKRIDWTWVEWYDSLSISQDGQTMIVSNEGDGVYFSTDMGSTWTSFVEMYQYSDGDFVGGDNNGCVVKVSRDGSTFYVGTRDWTKAYMSTNSGATWFDVDFTGSGIDDWMNGTGTQSIGMSDDGSVIVVAGQFYAEYVDTSNWQLAISTDSGATWAGIDTPASESTYNWTICCDSDASLIYLADYANKKVYKSTDLGTSWILAHTWVTAVTFSGIACTTDGTTVWAWGIDFLWRAVNSGSTWLDMYSQTLDYRDNSFAESVVINDDGSYILLQCDGETPAHPVKISEDSGQSFALLSDTGKDTSLGEYLISAICGSTSGYILLGAEALWISSYGVTDLFSDNGLYPAVVIHGDPVESGGNALRNQTKIRCDWRLPFVQQYIEWPPDSIVEYRRIRVQPSTFWTAEKSVESSRPIELHKFTTDVHVWRYADAPNDVNYTGGGVIWYRGNVMSVSFKQYDRNGNREAEIIVDPFMSDLQTSGLTMRYERVCATYLGSDLCDIDLTDSGTGFSDTGVLTAVDGTSLTADEFGLQVDGWWEAGKIVVGDYKRKVMSHTGTTIIISYVIPSLAVGDAFTVYTGCDKVDSTCLAKFNNIANFRGFPNIPKEDENPFGPNGY